MKYSILAIGWILYCIIHSGMISLTITEYLTMKLGDKYKFYRFFFCSIAGITIIPIGIYSFLIKTQPFFVWSGYLKIVQIIMMITTATLFLAPLKNYSMFQFLGLSQIIKGEAVCNVLGETCELNTSGILGLIRHPWYSGTFLLIWARDIDISVFITNMILSIYLIVGTLLEERKLVKQFGEKYINYQKDVSMFIPLKILQKR